MNSLNKQKLAQVLQDYVAERWSYREVAVRLGVTPAYAHRILSGHAHKDVQRPEGFQFPWPEHSPEKTIGRVSDTHILEAYELYEKHLWSITDFANYLGITYNNARAIFNGLSHKNLKRPDVPYRGRVSTSDKSVHEWYNKKKEEDLAKVAAYL